MSVVEVWYGKSEQFAPETEAHRRYVEKLWKALRNKVNVQLNPMMLFDDENVSVRPDILVSGADMPKAIIEVVSPDTICRDYVAKRELYMGAGVPEYWVVNCLDRTVVVFKLNGEDLNISIYNFSNEIPVSFADGLRIKLE